LKPKQTVDNIRLASIEDIAAMKLSAITGRASRKDFVDIYFLLIKYSLKELVEFYNQKYHDGSEFLFTEKPQLF
jgi:predicted nucleotidyltransferase component of viral defense system